MFKIDHLILAVKDLYEEAELFNKSSGVMPNYGGKHPMLGTHNAIVSLGDIYFELLSLDPEAIDPKTRFLSTFQELEKPVVISWALQCNDLEVAANSLTQFDLSLSQIKSGERKTPSGDILKYEYANIVGPEKLKNIIPFLIKWNPETTHPSISAPQGCSLKEFAIRHTGSDSFTRWIKSLNLGITLIESDDSGLGVTITTPNGVVSFT